MFRKYCVMFVLNKNSTNLHPISTNSLNFIELLVKFVVLYTVFRKYNNIIGNTYNYVVLTFF